MLESELRALTTQIMALFPKNVSQKMAHWVGAQGQVTSAKMALNLF